jgi:competence protein ComEC
MLADVFLATLAAILMTMPVMLVHFNTLSLISPLANFLILPAQPGVMILGGLATITGMVAPAVAEIPAWPAWFLLTYTIRVVQTLAQLPYTTVDVSFLAGGAAVYYGLLFALTWMGGPKETDLLGRSRRSRLLRAGLVAAVFMLMLLGVWVWNQPDGDLHITFFDVGQGDAILIESPAGRQVVVDGGRFPSIFLDELGQAIPFWDKEIDIVVATHPDEDHILGLVPTFDHYAVDLLLVNGEADESAAYRALQEAASEQQTLIRAALAGEIIDLGDGARLEILHPGSALDEADRNENSVALRLVYGDFAALLTGDAEEEAEQAMIAGGYPLQSTVFKAGHHGSRSSSSRAFLQAVRPQIVVISAGKENNYEHPHGEVLERAAEIGATILRTDEQGSIEVITNGQQMWWETER